MRIPCESVLVISLVLGALTTAEALEIVSVRQPAEVAGFAKQFPQLNQAVCGSMIAPGLETDYVPQGVGWLDGSKIVLSYYDKGKAKRPSLLVVADVKAGRVLGEFRLFDVNGKPYTGHAGGVAGSKRFLWTGSAGRLLRFAMPGDPVPKKADLQADAAFNVDSTAAFVSVDGDNLWVGDYSYGRRYPTPKHHHARGRSAWAAMYRLDRVSQRPAATKTYRTGGKTVLRPDRALFIPQQVQGIAFCRDVVALSISYSYSNSKLSLYRSPLGGKPFEAKTPGKIPVNAVVLDRENHIKTIDMPAGSEGIAYDGRQLAVVFEGGSRHYRDRWRLFGGAIEDRILVLDFAQLKP